MSVEKPSLLFRAIKRTVKLVYRPFTFEGLENLPAESAVIVGNHAQLHGPLCMELYASRPHYTWCASEMMSFREVPAYAYKDFWSGKPKSVRWVYKITSYLIAPLACLLFNNAKVIPVYRDTRLLSTFRLSAQRLDEGADIVIYPEGYDHHNHIVYDFQKGFVDVALYYRRKSAKNAHFVPMYLCPALKKVVFGKPTQIDPDKPFREEAERVRLYLMDQVTQLALALPPHRVIPYPNMAKKDYPMSR